MKDSRTRSIFKGLTWRFIASGTTMSVVYLLTGNLELVAGVGVIDVIAKLMFYYLHEQAWGKIIWGKLGPEPSFATCKCDCHPEEKTA